MDSIKIVLKKSLIGGSKKQIDTAQSLGLKKIGDSTTQKNNPQTIGKINIIKHLISVHNV